MEHYLAIIVVLVVVLVAVTAVAWTKGAQVGQPPRAPQGPANTPGILNEHVCHFDVCDKHGKAYCTDCAKVAGFARPCGKHGEAYCESCARAVPVTGPRPDIPEQPGVYESLTRLYSTADVDPLITGNLYAHNDFVRDVYAQRTSHGDVYGLTEYSSSGAPGDVGVDIGPFGLDEYGGRQFGWDDGIPGEWNLPSTPVRWYVPEKRDYFGPEGPTPYTEGLYPIREPDHDPLMGDS